MGIEPRKFVGIGDYRERLRASTIEKFVIELYQVLEISLQSMYWSGKWNCWLNYFSKSDFNLTLQIYLCEFFLPEILNFNFQPLQPITNLNLQCYINYNAKLQFKSYNQTCRGICQHTVFMLLGFDFFCTTAYDSEVGKLGLA